jgi:hypothetical protein
MTPPSEDLAAPSARDEAIDGDFTDPARPLHGPEARRRAQQRTLYLAASLVRRGFTPDLPRGEAGAAPQIRYLDRYVRLVRLLTHGERLFGEILPRIRNRLSFTPERYTEARPFQARGPVNWPATLRGAWMRGETNPTVLVSRRPTREYATPENQLAALTVVAVRRDAAWLLRELGDRLDPAEDAQLHRLVMRAERTRRVPQLAALMDQLPAELVNDPEGPEARRLELDTYERARYRPRTMTAYLDLVAWREAWRSWLTDAARALRNTPIWEVDDNELYEFVVLFELANAFAERSWRAVQRRAAGGGARPLFRFRLDDGRELELWYQTSHGLSTYHPVRGTPDVVIRIGGRTILGDMKNYAPRNYTQAIYKMLGYLYNFGYPDRWHEIDAGVLFFPEPSEQHPGFRLLEPRIALSPGRSRQEIGSLIIPPAGLTSLAELEIDRFVSYVLAAGRGAALPTGA